MLSATETFCNGHIDFRTTIEHVSLAAGVRHPASLPEDHDYRWKHHRDEPIEWPRHIDYTVSCVAWPWQSPDCITMFPIHLRANQLIEDRTCDFVQLGAPRQIGLSMFLFLHMSQ